ncbi:unnamed protein product [Effrenium voratum]|uniref:Uncharacterized protein n=1 Tax=Effrenium voratum TaxID=2562239 RepID=A0AA36IY12_9DINO|nr:unnamed protein product [Effrenium voratum]
MGNCGCFSFLKESCLRRRKTNRNCLTWQVPARRKSHGMHRARARRSPARRRQRGQERRFFAVAARQAWRRRHLAQSGRAAADPGAPEVAEGRGGGAGRRRGVCLNLEILAGGKRMMRCEALRTSAGSGDLNLPEELELAIPCLKPGGVFTALCRPFGLGELPATGLWQSLVACYGKEAVLKLELLEVQDLCLATLEGHERLDYAKGRKEAAGRFFKRQRFEAALERYSLAAEMLTQRDDIKDNALYSQAQEVKSLCELNAAACLLKLEKWRDAEAVCNAILRANPANEKALFRRGKALLALGDSARASADLRKVLEVNPNNSEAKQLLQQAKKESKGTARERNVYAKMLQSD